MNQQNSTDRAVAPVVGVSLLIAITVILAAVIGAVVLGVDIGPTDSPQATLSFEDAGPDAVGLYHEGGDRLSKDEIVVVNESGAVVHEFDRDVTTGHYVEIDLQGTDSERISVVWQDPSSSSEIVLGTFRP